MPEHAESNASADALVDVEEPLLVGSDDLAEKEGHCQHRSVPRLQQQNRGCSGTQQQGRLPTQQQHFEQ